VLSSVGWSKGGGEKERSSTTARGTADGMKARVREGEDGREGKKALSPAERTAGGVRCDREQGLFKVAGEKKIVSSRMRDSRTVNRPRGGEFLQCSCKTFPENRSTDLRPAARRGPGKRLSPNHGRTWPDTGNLRKPIVI